MIGLKIKKEQSQSFLLWLNKARYTIIGREADKGMLFKFFIYLILLDTAYIYLKPILHMITTMVKNADDLLDPSVNWFPRTLYLGNLQEAWAWLKYPKAFGISLTLSLSVAILQTLSCAVTGYAFARLKFPFKRLMFFLLLLTFIVPIQVTILPNIIYARELGLLNTIYPIIVPAFFGLGLKGALFVIIYRQFFSTQPKELEEAARIDGANVFKIFYKVMMPLAKPAILVVFLFSFVWTWNDFYLPSMYLSDIETAPLSMGISRIASALRQQAEVYGPSVNDEAIRMATTFMMIIPPMLLYTFTQRWFVEGVERTGLVE
ncbi:MULTISPECIES: carbohydrate ABC transporter permease [unclassified Paenibacillus]|uniref:carbohydrate ABC transporter permease n=1 Tax=unclassified Paenibacillus TaxID=185978 RepID=UPI002782EF32|nr:MULTISPECIES: carbohydrate ABC transporter permease [unclassified Paenibacillus]MDF2646003.1 transporter permease [Paenibacillus sp.]MDQ0898492.1 multiple sugar transport system permease protein [Paenibacillus sp. V4I7]MDQ0915515.1 multiple sugar transport system permease protein [Paenibacillus sp. V4I5]